MKPTYKVIYHPAQDTQMYPPEPHDVYPDRDLTLKEACKLGVKNEDLGWCHVTIEVKNWREIAKELK